MKSLKKFKHLIFYTKYFYKLYICRDQFTISARDYFKYNKNNEVLYIHNLHQNSIVYDVGGYLGEFSENLLKRYDPFIHLFEPVLEFHQHCKKVFNGSIKITLHNYALSNTNDSQKILKSDNSSSIHTDKFGELQDIQTRRISDIISELKHDKIDLLKLNVEGSEFLILLDLIKTNSLSKVNVLLIQFHNFYPNAKNLRNEIRYELSKTHKERWNYPFVWECWEKLI